MLLPHCLGSLPSVLDGKTSGSDQPGVRAPTNISYLPMRSSLPPVTVPT